MDLYYATTNKSKVNSLKIVMGSYAKVIQIDLDTPEPRSSDVEEIARVKIKAAYAKLQRPVVALDAGFYIHSLNGFPRAYVNFALETIGIEGIIELLHGKDRECEFRS